MLNRCPLPLKRNSKSPAQSRGFTAENITYGWFAAANRNLSKRSLPEENGQRVGVFRLRERNG